MNTDHPTPTGGETPILECPWPESVWTMTEPEYVEAIPDPALRTSVSGFLMRRGWEIALQEVGRELKEIRILERERNETANTFMEQVRKLQRELSEARAELAWQQNRNAGYPTKGGFEFYINEEWTGLAAAALDTDYGWHAAIRKHRIDPDDERVRVRRVIEDDEILNQLTAANQQIAELVSIMAFGEEALRESYDVTEWPATPDCKQSRAIKAMQAAISHAKGQE